MTRRVEGMTSEFEGNMLLSFGILIIGFGCLFITAVAITGMISLYIMSPNIFYVMAGIFISFFGAWHIIYLRVKKLDD